MTTIPVERVYKFHQGTTKDQVVYQTTQYSLEDAIEMAELMGFDTDKLALSITFPKLEQIES